MWRRVNCLMLIRASIGRVLDRRYWTGIAVVLGSFSICLKILLLYTSSTCSYGGRGWERQTIKAYRGRVQGLNPDWFFAKPTGCMAEKDPWWASILDKVAGRLEPEDTLTTPRWVASNEEGTIFPPTMTVDCCEIHFLHHLPFGLITSNLVFEGTLISPTQKD